MIQRPPLLSGPAVSGLTCLLVVLMVGAVQWELTLRGDLLGEANLVQAYGMLLVQMLWGFATIPAKLETVIGSTGCTVGRVLRRCPILQVRLDCS